MKWLRVLSLLWFITAGSALGAGISDIDRLVYGKNPLKPSASSLLGQYLAETKAVAFPRSFKGQDGIAGPERLVVLVSPTSFPAFRKRFGGKNFLYHFHEPHQHVLVAAFNGKRGNMGRLRDDFQYTYGGVLAIPILLTSEEGARAERYFDVAAKVSRKNDVALFPWRLTDGDGAAYCERRDEKSLVDWFVHLPVGEIARDRRTNAYDVCKVNPESIQNDIQQVWCAPSPRESLAETIGLGSLLDRADALTPGRIGSALLASASRERIPVVFRFVNDHVTPFMDDQVTPLPRDFDPYFDVDFSPATDCK